MAELRRLTLAVLTGIAIAYAVHWLWNNALAEPWQAFEDRVGDWRDGGRSIRIVAYGTSLTANEDWIGAVATAAAACGVALRTWNTAQPGADSDWGLSAVERRVLSHHPQIVLVEFSINDAYLPYNMSLEQSARNMDSLIDRLHRDVPGIRILLLTMNPTWGEAAALRPKLSAYYALYAEIARSKAVELVDLYPAWLKLAASDPDFLHRALPDGLHPSLAGHLGVTVPGVTAAIVGHPCGG